MLEFKLQLYFQEYKDSCIISTTNFKRDFKDKHGEFELLNELAIMIQRYQIKKYGTLITNGKFINKRDKKGTYSRRERARLRSRFGNKEERLKRNLEEKCGRK